MLFPDKANLYVCAIEDRDYKEEKIDCRFISDLILRFFKWPISFQLLGEFHCNVKF